MSGLAIGLGIAGASLLGGMMSNRANAKMAQQQMAFTDEQAQTQMNFQERMSNTAHLREVQDLARAGLNPILSGTGGMGASSAAGASGAGASAPQSDVITPALSSGIQARRHVAEVKNIEEDTKLKTQLEDKAREEKHLAYQHSRTQEELVKKATAEAEIFQATAKGAKIEGEIDQSKYGEIMRYLNRMNPFGTMGSGAIRSLPK